MSDLDINEPVFAKLAMIKANVENLGELTTECIYMEMDPEEYEDEDGYKRREVAHTIATELRATATLVDALIADMDGDDDEDDDDGSYAS